MNIFRHIYHALKDGNLYVTADPRDNSVTFSRDLFRHIQRHVKSGEKEARVIVFSVFRADVRHYGFMINPTITQPTAMDAIQINDRLRCIGFECLTPTVNRIFYDYQIRINGPVSLTVTPAHTPQGKLYYVIEKPKNNVLCQK